GVPGYEVVSWNGVFAPRGTPTEIIDLLNRAIREMVANPEVKQRYAELGIEAKASTPEELKARLTADIGKWAAVIEPHGFPNRYGSPARRDALRPEFARRLPAACSCRMTNLA